MKIPVLSGIYADPNGDFRTSYPVNLKPVPKATGVSDGYLRSASGVVQIGTGPGIDRGGIDWRGVCYRVMGSKLIKVDAAGEVTEIGDVGQGGPVSMSYGFEYLGIASGKNLFLYDGTDLEQVTDSDLGDVLDVVALDGYFITTDGEFIITTQLTDPFSVNPKKYGSSEADPDPVVGILRLNNELAAINRHTIEFFSNIGGLNFPFQVIDGTQIRRGAVGTHAATVFANSIAFVGSGQNEAISVFMTGAGGTEKIGTREIDQRLAEFTEDELSDLVIETTAENGHETLFLHLDSGTLCFDIGASKALGQPVWYELKSGVLGNRQYRARYFTRSYNKWVCGDPLSVKIGALSEKTSEHWGNKVLWEFGTPIIYNEGSGAILHDVTLACNSGSVNQESDAKIGIETSEDGLTWSIKREINFGGFGARLKPIKWTRLGSFQGQRALRFTGDSDSIVSIARIDARIEGLAW